MVFFIVVLRAIAACLITNSHYTGIYPTDLIANGGLIGDIIFFAVSGYCLCNIKKPFFSWYAKRLLRIYPTVLIATAVFFLLGQYTFSEHAFWWWFIYPTYYHFVGSILLLYVPFYLVMKLNCLRNKLMYIMLGTALAYLLVYLFLYDKSYYHIDTVREPMIWFLFFESMLLGAYFRFNEVKFKNNFKFSVILFSIIGFAVYFASKLFFSKFGEYSKFQIINQFLIFALLYCLFNLFAMLDKKLERLPCWLKTVFSFLSERTLEIYVVQYVLIAVIRPYFDFPLNWLVITASIMFAAWLLHIASKIVQKCVLFVVEKIKLLLTKRKGESN